MEMRVQQQEVSGFTPLHSLPLIKIPIPQPTPIPTALLLVLLHISFRLTSG